jgi:hypothetical protein
MKKYFLALLLYTNFCFSQNKLEYANLIQTDTVVKWAAIYSSYLNLTTPNPNFNIRNFYVNKLKQGGAIAYNEVNGAFAVTPQKISYADYIAAIKSTNYDPAKMNWWFRYDEKNNASEDVFNKESNGCDTCPVKNSLSFIKVKQLLYYRNHRFVIRNILLSPVTYKKTTGSLKEDVNYFESQNFAFDPADHDDNTIPASAKLIGRSCNNLVLLPGTDQSPENKILTINDWNLCHILYQDIKQRKIQAYSTEKSIYPDTKSILDYRKIESYKNKELIVPFYDSTGGIVNYKKINAEINFDSIYNFTLIQDLYFDFAKEKLYSKLIALVPRMAVNTSSGVFVGYTDYWGVIFPGDKKKIVPKKK